MKKTKSLLVVETWLVVATVASAWMLFNWQALQSLHQRWLYFDEPYAVGYPTVILSLLWVWRHRAALKQRRFAPSTMALLAVVVVLLAGVAARLVQLMLLQQLAALFSLWLILAAILGWSAGRFLMFPCALLALGIPVWDFLVDPLRVMTVWFTQHMLDLLAIPAHIDGFFISLPAGLIEVAGGCSGLNLFLAMLLVGLLFAESHHLPRERRIAIVLVAAAIGILDNWVRVFSLVLIAHQTQMQSNLVHHHGSFGWWIFAGSLLPYFWVAGRIEHGGKRAQQTSRSQQVITSLPPPGRVFAYSVVLVVLMVGIAQGGGHLESRRGEAERGFLAPARALPVTPPWLPQYMGQDVTQAWRMGDGSNEYDVVALTYLEQRADKKLIYFSNRIAEENALRDTGQLEVSPQFKVNTAAVYDGGWRHVWWFWWVDGSVSTSALKTKILQLRAMLFGDPSAALIAISTSCADAGCRQTMSQGQESVSNLLRELRQIKAAR